MTVIGREALEINHHQAALPPATRPSLKQETSRPCSRRDPAPRLLQTTDHVCEETSVLSSETANHQTLSRHPDSASRHGLSGEKQQTTATQANTRTHTPPRAASSKQKSLPPHVAWIVAGNQAAGVWTEESRIREETSQSSNDESPLRRKELGAKAYPQLRHCKCT